MANIMQQRRDTKAEWERKNSILAEGQIGYETDSTPWKEKVGRDNLPWNSLEYKVDGGVAPVVPPIVLVDLGDSLTQAYPMNMVDSPEDSKDLVSWSHYVRDVLQITVHNKGIGGQTTSEILARFNSDVVANNATHCVFMGGINDVVKPFPRTLTFEQTKANYNQFVALCKENNIVPIIGIYTPTDLYTDAPQSQRTDMNDRREWIRKWSLDAGLPTIEFDKGFIEYNSKGVITSLLSSDKLHPNVDGQERMGKFAIDTLKHTIEKFKGTSWSSEGLIDWVRIGQTPDVPVAQGAIRYNRVPALGDHIGWAKTIDGWLSLGLFGGGSSGGGTTVYVGVGAGYQFTGYFKKGDIAIWNNGTNCQCFIATTAGYGNGYTGSEPKASLDNFVTLRLY